MQILSFKVLVFTLFVLANVKPVYSQDDSEASSSNEVLQDEMSEHSGSASNSDSAKSEGSVTITVKNLFKKRKRQITVKDRMTHPVRICLAANPDKCSEEVNLAWGEEHAFTISQSDPIFASVFDSNRHLRAESMIVYVSGVHCSHENEEDKQFYPSEKIPYGMDNKIPHGVEDSGDSSKIEVYINRMVSGMLYGWSRGVCSIRYRDAQGITRMGAINIEETIELCEDRSSDSEKQNEQTVINHGRGVYPYNGYLRDGHFLATGRWDEDFKKFAIEKIRFRQEFVDEANFCANIGDYRDTLKIIKLESQIDTNVHLINAYNAELKFYERRVHSELAIRSIHSAFEGSLSAISKNFLENSLQLVAINTAPGAPPSLRLKEMEFESKTKRIKVLETILIDTTRVATELQFKVSEVRFRENEKLRKQIEQDSK